MVLDMEETVPESFAKRANVTKHVEYPNRDASKVFNPFLRNDFLLTFKINLFLLLIG